MGGFLRLYSQFILRSLRREKLRASLAVLGIALGVAVMTAIRLANVSVTESFRAAVDAVGGDVSLRVVSRSGPVDERQVGDLAWLEEYGSVSPIVEGYAMVTEPSPAQQAGGPLVRGEVLYVLGVDVLRDLPLRKYPLLSVDGTTREPSARELLDLLVDDRAVILTEKFAERRGYRVGDVIHLAFGSRRAPYTVRGLLRNEGPARTLHGNFALMDIAAAQWAADRLGQLDFLDLKLPPDVPAERVEREIRDRLPPGLAVELPGEQAGRTETMIAAFQFNLAALGSVALLVGLFLIYNTVSVSVAARRDEIGVLTAVGASRWTVAGLFLLEALLLALAGAGSGLLLGQWLSRAAVRATAQTVETFYIAAAAEGAAETVRLDFSEAAGLGGVALALSLFAAWQPAWQAAAAEPLDVIRGTRPFRRRRWPWGLLGAAAATGLGWIGTRLGPLAGRPVWGFVAELLFMLAAALATPAVIRAACWSVAQVARALSPRWQQVSRLAAANLSASISQTSVSMAALAMSLGMMIAIGIMVGSFRQTVVYWLDSVLTADLGVKPVMNTSNLSTASLDQATVAALRKDPAVEVVCWYSSRSLPYAEGKVRLDTTELDIFLTKGRILFKEPSRAETEVRQALARQRPLVLVSESFSLLFGKRPGDRIVLETPRGARELPVAAVYYDYSSNQGTVLLDYALYRELYGDDLPERAPFGLSVYLHPDADPEKTRDRLWQTVGKDRSLYIVTNRDIRREALRIFDSTFKITYALQSIAMLVAGAGVIATLVRLIYERRQELSLLSLVGATPGQMRRMIVLEATLIGGISHGIGMVVGLVLSLVLIYVINVQSFGWTIQLHLPWAFLAQSTAAVLLASAVCGLYPAQKAVGLDALATLREL